MGPAPDTTLGPHVFGVNYFSNRWVVRVLHSRITGFTGNRLVSPEIGLCSAGRCLQTAFDPPEIGLQVGSPFVVSVHGSAGFAPSGDLPHQSLSLSLPILPLSLIHSLNRSQCLFNETEKEENKKKEREEKKKKKEKERLGSHSVSLSDSPPLSFCYPDKQEERKSFNKD
jgi:hypothetical protein